MGASFKTALRLRAPRPATEPRDGPSRNFHKKYRENTPRAEILEPQENTPKIPKKYQNCAFVVFWGYFFGIFGAFWGQMLGVQNFGRGGYFFGIFRGNSGSGHFGAL